MADEPTPAVSAAIVGIGIAFAFGLLYAYADYLDKTGKVTARHDFDYMR